MKKFICLSTLLAISLIISFIIAWCANHTVLGWENTTNIHGASTKADSTLQQGICEIKWWIIETWQEWEKKSHVCIFNDESYCHLNELFHNKCSKWKVFYYNEDIDSTNSHTEKKSIVNAVPDLTKDLAKCSNAWEYIVCWQDGNTYFNRCYLEIAWTKEETKLAKVINWECVFW